MGKWFIMCDNTEDKVGISESTYNNVIQYLLEEKIPHEISIVVSFLEGKQVLDSTLHIQEIKQTLEALNSVVNLK